MTTRRELLLGAAACAGAVAAGAPATRAAAISSGAFVDRIAAGLFGMAIGDGMGAPVEGWNPEKIRERFGAWDFSRFLPSTPENHTGPGPGKGDGRLTDDMLLVEALMRAYIACGDHLAAYRYAEFFVPEIAEREVWVPEKQQRMSPLSRPLWWPERYAYHRLAINNVEPRTAGLGNWTNQGLQGFMLPVGIVNAGDPDAAYAEAIALGVAHNHSFALEGAAVMAAVFAAAMTPGASVNSAIAAGVERARDGTRQALDAVLAVVDPADSEDEFIRKVRRAYLPYAGLPPQRMRVPEPDTYAMAGTNMGGASRIMCIENLPVSLATLVYGRGDALATLRASILYGQDCESIAAGSLGVLGALGGRDALPNSLMDESAAVNQRDYVALAREFGRTALAIFEKDRERLQRRAAALGTT